MNLVIKIPKDAYDLLQNEGVDWLGAEHILDAVAKGKPLEECEDCVSLDAVIDVFDTWWAHNYESDNAIEILEDKLNALPPVKPMEKVGHWYNTAIQGEIDDQIVKEFVCSKCSAISVFRMAGGEIVNGDLCPKCGSKMQKPCENGGQN